MRHWTRRLVLILAMILTGLPAIAHESPVDHVSREVRLWYADGRLHVSYRLLITERAALLQLHAMDIDRDGKISDDERREFFSNMASDLAGRFELKIGDRKLQLRPDGDVTLDPALGLTFTFVTDEISLPAGKHAGELTDLYSRAYPGPYRFLPTDDTVTISRAAEGVETHPGTVIVRFDLTIPSK
jgi:hypothetical protein